jgi:hypothetical protein
MRLQAVLSRADLDALLNQLLPLKVLLASDGDDDRTLVLRDPRALTFVPGTGISLTGTADIRWSVLGLTVPIHLRELSVMLTPRLAPRAGVNALVFDLAIEHADLAGVPAVVDSHLVELVNQALALRQGDLGWEFAKTLTHSFALPAVLANVRSFNLGVGESTIEVVSDALVWSVELLTSVTRG